MRDVAAAAGVSHQTVANVLNTPQRVSPATRHVVEHHIAQLGYRPNRLAQNLTQRRSRLIGFRVEAATPLSGGVLDEFLQALAEAAEAIDHHIVLFHSAPGLAEVDKAAEMYRASVADAFVVAQTKPGDPRIPAFVEAELEFVSFGRTDNAAAHHWVDTDNVLGSRLATRHLIAAGHTSIAFLGWPAPSWVGDDRRAGWHAEMLEARLAVDHVAVCQNDRRSGEQTLVPLLRTSPDITAVVAVSDELAVGAQAAAIAVDRDISVVGYDDSALARDGAGLTSVRQPIAEIANRIVQITALVLDGVELEPIHERMPPRLVVRGSSSRNRSADNGSTHP